MKRISQIGIITCLALLLFEIQAFAYESHYGKTEIIYWDEQKTDPGYNLFATGDKTYLIDMEGHIIHRWEYGFQPILLENGNILDVIKNTPDGKPMFVELDRESNIVWSYTEKRQDYIPHHDWKRIYNAKLGKYTTLYIANKFITNEMAIEAGADTAKSTYDAAQVDAVVEIDMDGNIVWEWWFFDHIIQDFDSTKANYTGAGKTIADYPGKININMPGRPLKKDWLHCNSIDYNPDTGQIMLNSVQGEFYIIDHDNTFFPDKPSESINKAASEAGDFLYRFGDPARYNQGDKPSILEDWTASTSGHKQIGGSHHAHWIPRGLPGEGNILVFNNGQYMFERTSQSYIYEINPYLNAEGDISDDFVNPPEALYYVWKYEDKDSHKQKKNISRQIVWMYHSLSIQSFFSHIGSGAQRLPNGNTLICADVEGHFFEVTPGDADNYPEVVWEYINPVISNEIKTVMKDGFPMRNSVFRLYRYDVDYPGLEGMDLSPGPTITGREPVYYTPEYIILSYPGKINNIGADIRLNNYPNPFSSVTVIPFDLNKEEYVEIFITDINGIKIKTLAEGIFPSGRNEITWNGTDGNGQALLSNCYLCNIKGKEKTITFKILMMR